MTPFKRVTPVAVLAASQALPLSQICLFAASAGLKSVTPIADPACAALSVRIRRSDPIQKSDPCRSFGGLKSVTPVADLPLHWRPQKCDPYRRFPSSMRPKPQFGDPYRRFVDPADPDEIRWARYCDTYRTIRLVCRSAGLSLGLSWAVRCWVVPLGCPGLSWDVPLRTAADGCPNPILILIPS